MEDQSARSCRQLCCIVFSVLDKRVVLTTFLLGISVCLAQGKRFVIIDQDAAGPGGTDMTSILILLQSPGVETLGITVVTGDAWRDEEVAHTLRLLEIAGRTDIPVVPGAVFPLVRTQAWTEVWQRQFGKIEYLGAWDKVPGSHGPYQVPAMKEGAPKSKPLNEDAAHFLVRMVRKYPHQVTIYEGGPMTNLALALSLDPGFAEMSAGLVFMGGSINPNTADPEFSTNARHEFNLWFDPEASHIVLRAHWPSIVCTTVDVSVKTQFTQAMLDQIAKSQNPVAKYMAKYMPVGRSYLWDELTAAAWLDPSLITAERKLYMDVNLDRGAGYGDTLVWQEKAKPALDVQLVRAQMNVNMSKFAELMVRLLSAPTPKGAK
jgi:purine nucleosidase